MIKEVYLQPNPVAPTEMISIDANKCIRCNACVSACRTQTIMPHPDKGGIPVILYPDECWACGCCVEACKTGAIKMRMPINQKLFFKRKTTGDLYRIGSGNQPERTYFEPPVG